MLHADPYLRLAMTDVAPGQTGPSSTRREDSVRRAMAKDALPRMLAELGVDDDARVATAALAVARACDDASESVALATFHRLLDSDSLAVRKAAIVACGVLGDARARGALEAIATDSPTRDCDRCESQCLAALSLGLLGDPKSAPAMLTQAARARCDALRGSLLLGAATCAPRNPLVCATAIRWMGDRRASDRLRATAAMALSRVEPSVARASLASLTEALQDPRTPGLVADAITMALGRLARIEDREVLEVLRIASSHRRASLRQTALIAIGRLLEREAQEQSAPVVAAELIRSWIGQLERGRSSADRPWLAAALGLALRDRPSDLAMTALQTVVREERSPSFAGAAAIALGLQRDPRSVAALRDRLAETSGGALARHLVQALGLIGHGDARGALRARFADDLREPRLAHDLGWALAAIGDGDVCEVLGARLAATEQTTWTRTLATTLGSTRRPEAVGSLVSLVSDEANDVVVRGAVRALGDLAEPGEQSWYSTYAVDSVEGLSIPALTNYFLAPDA